MGRNGTGGRRNAGAVGVAETTRVWITHRMDAFQASDEKGSLPCGYTPSSLNGGCSTLFTSRAMSSAALPFVLTNAEIQFPPSLDNESRKYVHFLARDRGLQSKSYGKNEGRYIVLRKVASGDRVHIPLLKISEESLAKVKGAMSVAKTIRAQTVNKNLK
jgi:hypothetical protein